MNLSRGESDFVCSIHHFYYLPHFYKLDYAKQSHTKEEWTMIDMTTNIQTALKVLEPGYVSEDHYDGVHPIYRLAAYVKLDKNWSANRLDRYFRYLYRKLSKLSVRPNVIFIWDDKIVIDWYPRGIQMVMNIGQYAGLVLQFAKFLDNCHVKGLEILIGCFDDDPGDPVDYATHKDINFFPEFNAECFGSNRPIEIVDFSSGYWWESSWL